MRISEYSIENNEVVIEIHDIQNFTNEDREKVLGICHERKHLYLDGYPHGRGTRRKHARELGIVYEKWADSPKVAISYWMNPSDKCLIIHGIIDISRIKYSRRELAHFLQMWQIDVASELMKVFKDK